MVAQDPCQGNVLPIVAGFFDGFQGQQELSLLAVQIHLQVQVRLCLRRSLALQLCKPGQQRKTCSPT